MDVTGSREDVSVSRDHLMDDFLAPGLLSQFCQEGIGRGENLSIRYRSGTDDLFLECFLTPSRVRLLFQVVHCPNNFVMGAKFPYDNRFKPLVRSLMAGSASLANAARIAVVIGSIPPSYQA